jgi:succinyl-diaminopimelate desuccinylase
MDLQRLLVSVRQCIAIPSVSYDKRQVKAALSFYLTLAKEMGFTAYSLINDSVGIVEYGEGTETLGILVHMDVVAPGLLEKWPVPPFSGEIKDEKLFGRGAIDDKGPAIACLYALKAVKELHIPVSRNVKIIIGTQEEVSWKEIDAYVSRYPLPDFGFTPDGSFPVSNREKGYCDVVITTEKGKNEKKRGLYIDSLDGGSGANTIPQKATAVIRCDDRTLILETIQKKDCSGQKNEKIRYYVKDESSFCVEAFGKSAHSSEPQEGINAIELLCEHLITLPIVESSAASLVRLIAEKSGDSFGRKWGIFTESDRFEGEYVHHTTLAPTILGTTSEAFFVNYNLRFSPPLNRDRIKEVFEKEGARANGRVVLKDYLPYIVVPSQKPFLQILAQTYEEVSGLPNTFEIAFGTSYAKAMPNFVCWGPLFPGDEDTCHQEGEYISIERLIEATKIYALGIAKIVSETGPLK